MNLFLFAAATLSLRPLGLAPASLLAQSPLERMKKLLKGIVEFRTRVLPTCRDRFAELSKGQNPDVLFVTCSDSRVAPNWFASTDPGDLFVVRNVGNLIPPSAKGNSTQADVSALAAAEFSVLKLHVTDVVICGHSDCGAMNALFQSKPDSETPHFQTWLAHADAALEDFKKGKSLDSTLSPVNQVSQLNVLRQMEHLKSHSFIQERLRQGKLKIHGWWFDIAKADVYAFDAHERKFRIIDGKAPSKSFLASRFIQLE